MIWGSGKKKAKMEKTYKFIQALGGHQSKNTKESANKTKATSSKIL